MCILCKELKDQQTKGRVNRTYDMRQGASFSGDSSNAVQWPPYWKKLGFWREFKQSVRKYELVNVDRHDHIYEGLVCLVMNSWKSHLVGHGQDAQNLKHQNITIKKIQQIENWDLFSKYWHARSRLQHQSKSTKIPSISSFTGETDVETCAYLTPPLKRLLISGINECFLFHGSSHDKMEGIFKHGLDSRLGNNGLFGQGIYMSESSTKADQYAGIVYICI